jgi:hypothetical protein
MHLDLLGISDEAGKEHNIVGAEIFNFSCVTELECHIFRSKILAELTGDCDRMRVAVDVVDFRSWGKLPGETEAGHRHRAGTDEAHRFDGFGVGRGESGDLETSEINVVIIIRKGK